MASPDRQVLCPECQTPLSERDRTAHMIAVHGYLTISGTSLPLPTALACLWDRVFNTADSESHSRLQRLLGSSSDGKEGHEAYSAALEQELLSRLRSRSFAKKRQAALFIQNLRQVTQNHNDYWPLIKSADIHVRRIIREILLPEVASKLAGERTTGSVVRSQVEKLCPVDDIWEKVQVCQRLPNLGAFRPACKECLNELRAERPVACPECSAAVPGSQLETHLRQAHHIYQFRGVRRSQHETIAILLRAICDAKPEFEAWETLEGLAQDEYGSQAPSFLAVRISQELATLRGEKRTSAHEAVADVVAASGNGPQMAAIWASSQEPATRHLALNVITRLPPPLSSQLVVAVQPLLARKRAPKELQIATASALLRTTGLEGPDASRVVGSLIAKCSRSRALDRLRRLEEQVGACAAVRAFFTAIEDEMEMVCPRCQIGMKRPDMARHLWFEHELILDGQRIHPPWRAIREWIKSYRRRGNAELLVRCRTLGQHLDPDGGLERVNRFVLAYRVDDVEARQMLSARARQEGASLCPRCYALIPVRREPAPVPLNQSHGRLSSRGFSVEVSENGVMPKLGIDTPDAVLYRGREPGRWLTRQTATLLLAGLPVVAGLCLALSTPWLDIQLSWLVGLSIALGLAVYLVITLHWRFQTPPIERALNFAWTGLAPRLHSREFWSDEAAFLASLALSSLNRGQPFLRTRALQRIMRVTDDAVNRGECSAELLAPLVRLQATDAMLLGDDPVPELARQIGRCLEGERPLLLAERLLDDAAASWRTPANDARLRVLLCDRAFEAGLEVTDLLAAGGLSPSLGTLLETASSERLALLRLLWSLRPRRPWDRWAQAVTAFELAGDPDRGEKCFDKYPHLLLMDNMPPQIVVCDRGIVFRNLLFNSIPHVIEAKARREEDGVSYELVVDDEHFRMEADAGPLAQRLKIWSHYFFGEFLPQIEDVLTWKAPGKPKPLYSQEPVPCPECRRFVLPRVGDVGVPVGRGRAAAAR
jgi:hypothetical protein